MLPQSLECLGGLVCKKLLFSSCLSQVSQVPRSVRRNRLDSGHELSQRPHEFFLSGIPLPNQVLSHSSVIACHSNVSQLVTATAGSIWWGQKERLLVVEELLRIIWSSPSNLFACENAIR